MTLVIAAQTVFGASPQVKLTATSTTSAPKAVPNNSLISVVRNHADGTSHRVLTASGPRLIGGSWVWLDVHCPFNQAVTYTITAAGSSSTSAAVWLLSKQTWLVSSTRADLAVRVEAVAKIGDRAAPSRAARFQVYGGRPVFLSDGSRGGITGTLDLRVTKEQAYADLFASDEPILINTPGLTGWDLKWIWVQPGDVTYNNPADGRVSYLYRHVLFPFEQCNDPSGSFEPSWTCDDALAYWTSQGKVSSQGPTLYASALNAVTDTRL